MKLIIFLTTIFPLTTLASPISKIYDGSALSCEHPQDVMRTISKAYRILHADAWVQNDELTLAIHSEALICELNQGKYSFTRVSPARSILHNGYQFKTSELHLNAFQDGQYILLDQSPLVEKSNLLLTAELKFNLQKILTEDEYLYYKRTGAFSTQIDLTQSGIIEVYNSHNALVEKNHDFWGSYRIFVDYHH